MTASIFTIERRKNFPAAFSKFYEDLRTSVTATTAGKYRMLKYLDHCLRYWPHRCGATGIDDYLKEIGVDITNLREERDLVLALELFINLLHWAPKQDYDEYQDSEFSFSLQKNDVSTERGCKKQSSARRN